MTSMVAAPPGLAKIEVGLRKTTEHLARELTNPTDEPPLWTDFEWRIARAVVAIQGVSSVLRSRLRWLGPTGWLQFLDEQRRQSVLRHLEIRRLLGLIASRAAIEGVAFVALKGAALYQMGVYSSGERPMGDIDLLVRCDTLTATARLLESCGYESAFATRRHEVFQPQFGRASSGKQGEHIENEIKIEVHTKIAEHLPVSTVDITQHVFVEAIRPGLNEYPSLSSLLLHLLLHAAGNMRARALRLIQLHDIALLAACMRDDDWREFFALRCAGERLWWMWAPLHLTARYYPKAIQPRIFELQGSEHPWLLDYRVRRQLLSDVSWSNIRIEALPGVEWSRTPLEALRFIKSRAWPSPKARMELRENAAQIPGAAIVPWYGISHGSRIVRWILSRPPRVQTLLAVRAALAEDYG